MSIIDLSLAKDYLDIIHGFDDDKLQMLLDGAEDEAAQYMNRESLADVVDDPSSSEPGIPGSVLLGVMLLLQAAYQASPDEALILRQAAEVKLTPYRICWGV